MHQLLYIRISQKLTRINKQQRMVTFLLLLLFLIAPQSYKKWHYVPFHHSCALALDDDRGVVAGTTTFENAQKNFFAVRRLSELCVVRSTWHSLVSGTLT